MFTTIDQISDDILLTLSFSGIMQLKSMQENQLTDIHHGFGTWIRNNYSLWYTSPLTEKWRTDESSHDIREGIDYSEDHPDAVSASIIKALWHRVSNKL